MDTPKHVAQSAAWAQVKRQYGTPAIEAGGVVYTKHKIPFTPFFYGYCPKVSPSAINWEELTASAQNENVAVVNFDCPNVTVGSENQNEQEQLLKTRCVPAVRQTFAKYNVVLDITKPEEELLANMHHKTRYNIKYAAKNGVTVVEGAGSDLEDFAFLMQETAKRQKFYIHSAEYYKNVWEVLTKSGNGKLLVAKYNGKPLSIWMLFSYEGVLYYPYGAWSGEKQELFPNNLLCWEAIKLGKKLGCHTFDMWGAAKNPEDKSDPWSGFTRFKLGFGGKHVEYINSYDYVLNPAVHKSFNAVNKIRWTILNTVRHIR